MQRRYARPETVGRCSISLSILFVLSLVSACSPRDSGECQWTDDCSADELCRLGSCVEANRQTPDGAPSKADRDGRSRTVSRTGDAGAGTGAGVAPSNAPDTSASDPCPDGRAPNGEDLALNELLANVPTGAAGDTNGDGTRDPFDDEFIELVSRAETPLDLSSLELVEGGDKVGELGDICLAPGGVLVVFGGISNGHRPDVPDSVQAIVSPKRLGFTNSGSSLQLLRSDGAEIASFQWESAPAESYVLEPQIDGDSYTVHTKLNPAKKTSPGRCPDGSPLEEGCTASTETADASHSPDASSDAGARGR